MALNIKNTRVEALAAEVAELTGESKTEAIGRALEERRKRLWSGRDDPSNRKASLLSFLEREAWPLIPRAVRGKRLTKRQVEEILGYGRDGA